MSVKIRLQRRGRRKKPFYHIVVADARAPRDGRFIEKLGTYNPMTSPATIELDRDRTFEWLMKGAQPTDTARAILKFQGVMYRKHLQRGVDKGALSQEQADEQYHTWVADKDSKIRARREATAEARTEWYKQLSGTAKPIVTKVEEVPEDEAVTAEATEEATTTEATEESPTAEVTEDAPTAEVTEDAPAVETTEEIPAEEAEVTEEAPAEEVAEATEEAPAAEAKEKEAAAQATEEAPTEAEESPAEEAAAETEEAATEEKAEEATTEEDTTEEKD